MFRNAVYIGKVFGIPVRVHVSWLIVFVLITLSLAGFFEAEHKDWPMQLTWFMGAVASLLFFASVLAHELAHSLLARSRGQRVRDIVLFIFGGVSEITDESKTPSTEFLVAVVGPLTSVVIGIFFLLVALLTGQAAPPVATVSYYLGVINVILAGFNLIPGFPLDGGRVLRGILWKITGDMDRSTQWAARVGQVVAYLFIFRGIVYFFQHNYFQGLWIGFIGFFLENAALSSYRQVQLRHSLAGHSVEEVMIREYPGVSPDASVSSVVTDYILPLGLRCLPVLAAGEQMVGLLTIHDINRVGRDAWPTSRTSGVMIPMDKVKTTRSDENLWDALVKMTTDEVNQLPVVRDGKFEGLLTRGSILTFLRMRAELGL